MADPTTSTVAVDPAMPAGAIITQAGRVLEDGWLVAYPTDTTYGLAADPRLAGAVERLFHTKGRPYDLAIPLIGASVTQVEMCLGGLTAIGRRLADRFWPGPLTLVIRAPPAMDRRLLGGGDSVAVRVPDNAVARALAAELGYPVTSTSANRTGTPAALSAAEVVGVLGASVAFVIDAGPCTHGARSTIVDARGDAPVLVRDGVVTWDRVVQSLA